MNNIEEKALISTKNSYETIEIEANVDEYAVKASDSKYATDLPLSSGDNAVVNETPSKAELLYKMLIERANQVLDFVVIEKSYKMFLVFMAIGVVFIFLSLLMLPMFMLTPFKFIFTFATGSMTVVFSFIFLYGLKDYCLMLFDPKRKWLTASFLLSILLGLVFAYKRQFLLSLIFAVYQMIAVIMFTLSFIPGGQNGILFVKDLLQSPLFSLYESLKLKFASITNEAFNANAQPK